MADKQATWGGRFKEGPSELMQRFGESVSFDARLAGFDIQGSQAHARMLAQVGILTEAESDAICKGLAELLTEIEAGDFVWDEALEDVHMNIEQALTSRVPEAAKLHTGRSRNDQIATDMRLYFKWAAGELGLHVIDLIAVLLDQAENSFDVSIPGYTHLQRAQPVPMAHHLLAWAEMLKRDWERLVGVWADANVCPLGAGALAGSTLPLDRAYTAKLLGFVDAEGNPQVTANSMDSVADRDTFLSFAQTCATIGVHLSRVAEDIILWSSAEFGFVTLADTFTTGSSLMPQKKNPDAFELIRGKAARLQGHVQTLYTLCKGLPLTYNRDLQEDKPPVFDAFEQTRLVLQVAAGALSGMEPVPERCAAAVADPALLATDLVDWLVERGLPFRDAHHVVGGLVGASERAGVPLNEVSDADAEAVHPLLTGDWREVFSVARARARRQGIGMPGDEPVKAALADLKVWLDERGGE